MTEIKFDCAKFVKENNRIVLCITCGKWIGTMQQRLKNCNGCGSQTLRQNILSLWGEWFDPFTHMLHVPFIKNPIYLAPGSDISNLLIYIKTNVK